LVSKAFLDINKYKPLLAVLLGFEPVTVAVAAAVTELLTLARLGVVEEPGLEASTRTNSRR